GGTNGLGKAEEMHECEAVRAMREVGERGRRNGQRAPCGSLGWCGDGSAGRVGGRIDRVNRLGGAHAWRGDVDVFRCEVWMTGEGFEHGEGRCAFVEGRLARASADED